MYKEIAKKYNITEKQAIELDEQYWMEYVIKTLENCEHDRVILEFFGTFTINDKFIRHQIKGYEKKLSEVNPRGKFHYILSQIINKGKHLIKMKENETIPKNSKKYKPKS